MGSDDTGAALLATTEAEEEDEEDEDDEEDEEDEEAETLLEFICTSLVSFGIFHLDSIF